MEAVAEDSTWRQLSDEIAASARKMVRSGLLWKNNHGNISARLPGRDEMLLTGSVLEPFDPSTLTRVRLDGEVLKGEIAPMAREIVQLHAVVYRHRPEVGGVVHAHSPHATAYALAATPMPVYTMALARLTSDPLPVSRFGPRGSEQEVESIAELLDAHPGSSAILLRNHGLLAFGPTVDAATRLVFAVEENAEGSILAGAVGGAKPIPESAIRAAQERKREFERLGPISR
jgi:L-ribulose-5-phosphate 4-epimerase